MSTQRSGVATAERRPLGDWSDRVPLASSLGRRRALDVWATVGAMALATAVAGLALRVWHADLSIPFEYYTGDANSQLMMIKGVLTHGWWFTNHDLGAPFGQQLYDFSVGGDNLHIALIKLLGLFTSSPGAVANLFYLLSFPLAALSAMLVIRWWGISRLSAMTVAVLFAVAPYAFLRGEHHPFLEAYYGVPLACYLALAAASGRTLFARREGRFGFLTKRTLLTVLCCIVVGSTGSFYYAAFALALLIAAALMRALIMRSPRGLIPGALVIGVIAVVVIVNEAPTLLYIANHGRDEIVGHRLPGETVHGGFTFGDLIFPAPHHRVQSFAQLRSLYGATGVAPGSEVDNSALGLIASLGFVGLLGIAIISVAGGGALRERFSAYGHPAALALVCFLVGTVGGVAVLVSYLFTAQLREWNRISIFLAFFALLAVGLWLDWARRGFAALPRWWGAVGTVSLAALVLAFGVWDQTSNADIPTYSDTSAAYRSDGRFVNEIERRLPPGALIFQLPYMPFPETPNIGGTRDYDPLAGYLHSSKLRWSYGAMKGRPAADWQEQLVEKPFGMALAGLAAAGFDGIWIDRYGYPDHAKLLSRRLRRLLGRPLVSPGRRYLFFDLRGWAGRLRQRVGDAEMAALLSATLHPPRVEPGPGIWPGEDRAATGQTTWWATSKQARLELVNPSAAPIRVSFSAFWRTIALRSFRLRYPDGARFTGLIGPDGKTLRHEMTLQPGSNSLRIVTRSRRFSLAADERTLYVQILNPALSEQAFSIFPRCGRLRSGASLLLPQGGAAPPPPGPAAGALLSPAFVCGQRG